MCKSLLNRRGPPAVLHVDDDGTFLELVEAFLTDRHDFEVTTATDADAGLDALADDETAVECVISDYEMPGRNGIEFLRAVRERHPDLPFVLYTGKGSESVAADAIAAGVTEYIQKETGTAQYAVLANRVEQAVQRYRGDRRSRRRLAALDAAREGICLIDDAGTLEYVNPAYATLYGYDAADLIGSDWRTVHPADEVDRIEADVFPTVEARGGWSGTSVGLRSDGTTFPESKSIQTLDSGGFVIVVCDMQRDVRQFDPAEVARQFSD